MNESYRHFQLVTGVTALNVYSRDGWEFVAVANENGGSYPTLLIAKVCTDEEYRAEQQKMTKEPWD